MYPLFNLPARIYKELNQAIFCTSKLGVVEKMSIEQFNEICLKTASFILKNNKLNSKGVITLSENRIEWNIVDYASMMCKYPHIGISPNLSEHDLIYIFNQTKVSIAFISGKFIFRRIAAIRSKLLYLKTIVSFDGVDDCINFREIAKTDILDINAIQERIKKVKVQDVATIIYTSGSTGTPKGVQLSHTNILSGIIDANQYYGLKPGELVLSYLPLSHSFERWMNYVYQSSGLTICYADSFIEFFNNFQIFKPHALASVPLLLEKIYDKILSLSSNNNFKVVANKLLGIDLRVVFVAGASLSKHLFDFYNNIGIAVYEIYGSSETLVISTNSKDFIKQGSVGKLLDPFEIKFSEQSEILLRGKSVFNGYFDLPEITNQAIDAEQWYHTGDKGHIDNEGFVFLQGRLTDFFKKSSGDYIQPVKIENNLKQSEYIKHVLVVGENQRFLGALIITDKNECEKIFNQQKRQTNKEAFIKNIINKEIEKYNSFVIESEIIKYFRIVDDEWSIESGEFTSSFKIKRSVLLKKYHNEIIEMFN